MVQRVSTRFFNSFLICCLLCLTKEVSSADPEEFCKAVTNITTNVATSIDLTYSQTNATQNECVKYYQIDLSQKQSTDLYLSFEISFVTKPNNTNLRPFLIQQTNAMPVVLETGEYNDSVTLSDIIGYGNDKSYYYIVVDIGALQLTDSLYFAVYEYWLSSFQNNYLTEQIIYNITTRVSNNYPCPLDCSGSQGTCDQGLKQCVCNKPFFDEDCSASGTLLPYGGSVSQVVSPDKWTYFYVEAKDYGGNLKLTVAKDQGLLYLAFLFNHAQEFFIPNLFMYDGRSYMGSDSLNQALKLPGASFKDHTNGTFMIGALNNGNDDIHLQLSVSFSEDDDDDSSRSAIMFVMIGIACGLIFLWVVFSLLKYRAYRHAALVRRQQIIMLQQSLLTKEEVDKYFPLKKFSEWTSSFPQTLCSICLDDFQPDTLCRQLVCEHIFHGPCIEAWFSNHTNCPNCKKDITREVAEEHLKNPNKPKPEPKSPDVEEGKLLNNGSSPDKHIVSNISKEILSSISLDDGKDNPKNGNEIDLDLPLSKRNKSSKLDKAQIILEPVETLVTPVEKSTSQTGITGIEIKSEIQENKDVKYNKELGKSMHEEH